MAPLPALAAPPVPAPWADGLADRIVVYKRRRILYLMRGRRVLRSYDIALGFVPEGDKQRFGDGRTPEGSYIIDWRNPRSDFHLSLHISYPRVEQRRVAEEAGHDPGGAIMIHGLPNGSSARTIRHPAYDWTNGCIAVTNAEIEEIWSLVADGTEIIILP
jgi:murein L,D-transpeptidase YafK